MSWTGVQSTLQPEQIEQIREEACHRLATLPFQVLRNRREVGQRADQVVRAAIGRLGMPMPDANQLQALIAGVAARVGGLGFLDGLLPPASQRFTDILVNGDGTIWGRAKGAMHFE